MLTVGVLGPLEVAVDGRPVRLPAGRLPALLAVLAMAAGSPLSLDRLTTALWDGQEPPHHARRVVQTYVARLRAALGPGHIVTEPAGYRLLVDPERVDALRFTRLLEAAARAGDPASQRAWLDEALALWRGNPFDGASSGWLARSEAPQLVERYLGAVERRIDLDLADGRHAERVAQLQELTARYPLRESLWVRLLLALDRCGRQAEALAQYETVRRRLADELGTDPGPELRQIHADLLAGVRSGPAPVPVAGSVVPRQLPPAIDGFAGRTEALKALQELLGERDEAGARAVVSAAIVGTAGVGKTTLAVHWAHEVADQFPDGQLYVNLRGYGPSDTAMAATEAIRGFLDALGVPPQRIPSDPQAQVGLYRSLVAGKRVLVLLDNARDADQARPLLPGSPSCLAVVTSRSQLTGLVVTETARPLTLDLLPIDESRELLARRIGADRVAAAPRAVDEIIASCARLPLALAIVAARAAVNPTFPLDALARGLADTRSGLETLAAGDAAIDLRAVLSWSYDALSPAAAQLFRLLGLHPGPDIATAAVASLAGHPVPRVRPLLAELTRAHLLSEPLPGRYAFHDLLRAYASQLADIHDSGAERGAATHRMLDHYLYAADAAAGRLSPHREPIATGQPVPGVTIENVADRDGALAWLAAERPVLLATAAWAAETEVEPHAWQLAWTLTGFLYRQGHWHDWEASQRTALVAAQRFGDRQAQAHSHRHLGNVYTWLGRHSEARTHLMRAGALYRELGDPAGQAQTCLDLSIGLDRQGHYRDALPPARQALDLFRSVGDRIGQADALGAIGWDLANLGEYQQAIEHCQRALALQQEIGDARGESNTWDSLGYAHHRLGRHREAIACYQRALELFRELGDRYTEATTLNRLGETYLAAGDREAARTAWRSALAFLEELGHPYADQIRASLAHLDEDAS